MGARYLVVGAVVGSALLGAVGVARASSGIDSPDNGAVSIGRGATYVARADDPLAATYNPAGLAFQKSGVYAGAHLMFMNRCFSRRGPSGAVVDPGPGIPGPGSANGPEDPVCADTTPFPNPQIAANFRITKSLSIGISVMGPHGVGKMAWPESQAYTTATGLETTQPAPQRYLLTSSDSLIFNPTLSVSYAIKDWLSIGAGFIWGVASIEFVNFSQTTSQSAADNFVANPEVKSTLSAFDGFIPGVVVGVLASPHKRLDLGASFRWQDAIRTKTDLKLESNYWRAGGQKNENPCPGQAADCNITDEKEAGTLLFRVPLEARLGFRYHHPQRMGSLVAKTGRKVRDPLAEDLFDLEVDFTYAHNSVVDNLEVRFHPGIVVRGVNVGEVPQNADIPHKWKNVFGVRVGGDYVVIPGFIALRAGGFFETNGQDPAYLNPDFHLGHRIGVGGGGTVRLGRVDLSLAYQHTFFETLDNGGEGEVKALSGDATTNYRSQHNVNGGRLESSLNEVALGATVKF